MYFTHPFRHYPLETDVAFFQRTPSLRFATSRPGFRRPPGILSNLNANRLTCGLSRASPWCRSTRVTFSRTRFVCRSRTQALVVRVLTGTFFKQLRPSILADCQLPGVMRDADGEFRKPTTW